MTAAPCRYAFPPRSRIFGLLLAGLLAPSATSADGGGRVEISVDSRAWMMPRVRFAWSIDGAPADLEATASVAAPVLTWKAGGGLDTWEFAFGVDGACGRAEGAGETGARLGWSTEVTVKTQDQDLGSFLQLGVRAALRPAWDFGTLDAGLLLALERGILTRISLSDNARACFADPDDAADGWYAWPSAVLRFGAAVGADLGDAGNVRVAGGVRRSPGSLAAPLEGFPLGEWPFWFELGWTGSLR